MRELTGQTAGLYIAERFSLPPSSVRTTSLGGGVSNHVELVEMPGRTFVLKQSLPKLRVQEDWFSDQSRIFREAAALRRLAELLPRGSVPEVLFEDRDNFAYAMAAAGDPTHTWKRLLLQGEACPTIAQNVAAIQATMIQVSFESADWRQSFGDLTAFDQLRLDPYYRFTAARHPKYASLFQEAIDRCYQQPACLVHGDWSPKNMMVNGTSVTAIDFEVIHYGDPAFDCGFLLNHLILKAFYLPQANLSLLQCALAYWDALLTKSPIPLEEGTLLHLPLLMLARVDGKSPVEYIRNSETKQRIRECAFQLMDRPAPSIPAFLERATIQ